MLQKLKIFSLNLGISIFVVLLFCFDVFSHTTADVNITHPLNGDILRGTVAINANITVSYGFTQFPTPRVRTSGFGIRGERLHQGVDTGDPLNSEVEAVMNGTAYTRWYSGYGNTVIIDHGNGLYTLYGHLNSANIINGQQVNRGDVIGYSGNSPGNFSNGNPVPFHLHFKVVNDTRGTLRWSDIGVDRTTRPYAVNPDDYLPTRIRIRTAIDENSLNTQDYPQGTTNINYSTRWNTTQVSNATHTIKVDALRLSELANSLPNNPDERKIGTDSVKVIVDNSTKVVEVPIQKTASPATLVAGGFQAASSLYFWDNQNNYWERWINSNLRVDSDNIIRYNAGTSNLDNPNLRHRVYLESRIYPAGAMQPKASCVNKKETNQAITYTFASQPFKLLPYTKEDGSVVYRPDVNEDGTITYPADTVTFINNEVVFAPKKEALPNLSFGPIVPGNPMYTYPVAINIPPTYQGVSSNQLDTYINQVGAIYSLEAVQKGYDYARSLSIKPEFNPTINIAYVQNQDVTSEGITCFGSNTAGTYRLLVNSERKDEYNEDKGVQAYGNALLTHYTGRRYGQGYADDKLPLAPISYTMSAEQSFVDGFCMRFSSAVRGTSIVELPVQQKGVTLDLSQSTHRGTTSALAVAQAISRIPMGKIWQALESPTITLNHSGYTVLDLLDELEAQGS